MSLLTTAQLTFCDLKDSYSIHVDVDCIGLVCDNNGIVSKEQIVTINYRVFTGSTLVGTSCAVSELPSGVTLVSTTSSSSSQDGRIVLNIAKGATLNNELTSSMKVTFTTIDAEQFTFDKYITFVKSMVGADGTDAVNFQIYSVDGFEFQDGLETLELNTVAFKGGVEIESGATYQWKWWNAESTEEDKYEDITDATSKSLAVNKTDIYAFTGLKCVLTYDGQVYEDYVSLTAKTAVYTSAVKFFNGSNSLSADDTYLIAYIELYQDNKIVETVSVNSVWYSKNNTVQDSVITTDLTGDYTDNDMMYFVCKNDDKYDVVLGVYSSAQWILRIPEYIYKNDLFDETVSNVFIVPREKVSRSLDIDIEIYKKMLDENGAYILNDNTIVSRTIATVMDLNDPIVSGKPPAGAKEGQLWLDTSVSPSILKMWDGTRWVNSGYQNGGAVYTSKPAQYAEGDLWILADNETCGEYGPGTMLKATESSTSFDEAHWVDAMAENTEVINNVKQYFLFNKETGLRIGQQDEKFYVNISATEMGFYDNSDSTNPDQKVVSIGNKSATIKNVIVNESAEFNCATTFNSQVNINGVDSNRTAVSFVWQIESNGSLSLSIGEVTNNSQSDANNYTTSTQTNYTVTTKGIIAPNNTFGSYSYSDSFKVENGEFVLISPTTVTISGAASFNAAKGKYIKRTSSIMLHIPSSATFTQKGSSVGGISTGASITVDSCTVYTISN